MTVQQANNNIGQSFKVMDFPGLRFDVIKEVLQDGTIVGDFMEANCGDCRLKEAIPEGLKKNQTLFDNGQE